MPEHLLRPLHEKVKALGLWMLDVPQEYGGAGLDLLSRCVIQEEISRTVALPFRGNPLFGPDVRPILFYCNEEQKQRFLYPVIQGNVHLFRPDRARRGQRSGRMKTTAVRDGNDYIINGTKRFISGAGHADCAQVIAVTDQEKRARGGISCFMVDMKTPGVVLERQWHTMMGDAPWQIFFDNVRVPAANIIDKEGEGFSLGQKWITSGRIKGHGARSVGIAQRALDMMIEYSKIE
jgi:acyl-CoA dehydrogenase